MTLVVAINTRTSIWLLTDRRLSYRHRLPTDDACKMMFLDTSDGIGMLGYAGLGRTAAGTQPANWMSRVLNGRNWPFEQSLGAIADALKREFPKHVSGLLPRGVPVGHNVVIPAIVNGTAAIYTIDLILSHDRGSGAWRCTRHVTDATMPLARTHQRSPVFALGGTGGGALNKCRSWPKQARDILRLVRACERKRISAHVVADRLAALNYSVHTEVSKSCGPSCVVAWRFDTRRLNLNGGHQFYEGPRRVGDAPGGVPSICRGIDMQATVRAIFPHFFMPAKDAKSLAAYQLVPEEVDARLAELPKVPDEKLT